MRGAWEWEWRWQGIEVRGDKVGVAIRRVKEVERITITRMEEQQDKETKHARERVLKRIVRERRDRRNAEVRRVRRIKRVRKVCARAERAADLERVVRGEVTAAGELFPSDARNAHHHRHQKIPTKPDRSSMKPHPPTR